MSFVNLHSHSHYSLLDGFGSPEAIILRTKELGYPAAALTDHGVTYGLVEFYKAAKKEGIKPILGCEMYIAPRTRFDKEPKIDVKPYHLTLLAKNNEGYKNLLQLVTKANLEGFYYKPRVDYGLLKTYGKGLIALSGCIQGHLPRLILDENEEDIHAKIKEYIDIFGKDDFYLEMQDHPLLEEQGIVNERLKKLAKEYDLQLVVTNDSHYPRPEDSEAHDILLCIQTGTNVNEENRMRYTGDFSIREVDDLRAAFPDTPEAIENTVKIAEKCNVDYDFGTFLIPSFDTPQNEDPHDYLRRLCEDGLTERFGGKKVTDDYIERLNYELKTVHEMGFDTYFLIVHDFVKYAKEQKIVVGPGRGSAAGSIIAWSLAITDLDPIKYGLFFERFLNPERVSMPDIDIDFADNRRDEVLEYVSEKYGRDNVAQIITFGTMAPRAAVRDVGRALGYPYQEVDQLAKIVPLPVLGKHVPLKVSIKDDADFKNAYDNDPRAKKLLDYAMQLEGTVRHAGTHACAVVITEKPLTEYTALQYGAGGKEEVVTQFSMKPIEELGLLKMDFLGLKNLTVIETTCNLLKDTQNKNVDINKIPMDDEKTFKLLRRADTTGVFQLESSGMRRYLKELKPNMFDDIVAMGALYRPGPMEWIPTYIDGKHNPDKVKYLDDSFKSILENTYGVAVYQEQILQLARDFAGFSLGEADLLRKAVGKKIASLLAEQREKFVEGAVKNGHDEKFAREVFEKVIEPFAGYGFNKAHAVCYGLIAYQTAYLKAHFPVEFMTALLCSDANNTERVILEIKECNEKGIDVLPPSVNESFKDFTIVNKKKIRFGLLAIKGIGEGPIKEIIDKRKKDGPFKSLEDFATRVPAQNLNKKVIKALACSGAMDEFGERNQIAENYAEITKFAKLSQQAQSDDQTSIFGMMDDSEPVHGGLRLDEVPKASKLQCLKWEKELLGMYVSGHPLRGLKKYLGRKSNQIASLDSKMLNKNIKIIGMLSEVKRIMTKAGGYMVPFTVEDSTGKMSGIMFSKAFAHFGEALVNDHLAVLTGRFDNKRGYHQIMCDSAKVLSIETVIKNAKEFGSFDPDEPFDLSVRNLEDILAEKEPPKPKANSLFTIEVPKGADGSKMNDLKNLLLRHKGDTPVSISIPSSEKKIKLPFGVDLTDKLKKSLDSLLK
jgi:DNA polymerase III subunit alpha